MSDFATRQKEFGLVSLEETRTALRNPETIVLDIRRPDEIQADGTLEKRHHPNWHNVVVSLDDASALKACAPTTLPNKNDTIFIYCRSGRRATHAVETLHELGYTNVMNGGGWSDVQAAMTGMRTSSQ